MKGQKKTRFQTYMYDESESDIIDFINSFREDDIRMIFISAMRLYMTFSGHYFRSNLKDANIKSDIPMAGNGVDKPGSDQDNEEEIEVMERLSRLADEF